MGEGRVLRIKGPVGVWEIDLPLLHPVRERVANIELELIDCKSHLIISRRFLILTIENDKLEILTTLT